MSNYDFSEALSLDFSYKYRLLVGDKLNPDIKYLIWKIYRRMVCS